MKSWIMNVKHVRNGLALDIFCYLESPWFLI